MLNTPTTNALVVLLACLLSLTASGGPVILKGGGGGGGGGAFTFVGKANGSVDGSGSTITSSSGTISVVAGDLIIAAVQWEDDSTAEVSTLNDNNNDNALAKDSEIHNIGQEINLHLWYGLADTTNAAATFDALINANVQFKKMIVMVYRPSGGTPAKDISGTPGATDDTNSSSSVVTGSFSTSGSSDVVCAFAGFYTGGSWSAHEIDGVGADRIEAPSGMSGWCDDDTAALSGATATASYSANRYWAATAIAFEVP